MTGPRQSDAKEEHNRAASRSKVPGVCTRLSAWARDIILSVPEWADFLFGSPLLPHGLGGVMNDGA